MMLELGDYEIGVPELEVEEIGNDNIDLFKNHY